MSVYLLSIFKFLFIFTLCRDPNFHFGHIAYLNSDYSGIMRIVVENDFVKSIQTYCFFIKITIRENVYSAVNVIRVNGQKGICVIYKHIKHMYCIFLRDSFVLLN